MIVDDEPRTRQGLQKMLEAWAAGSCRIVTADNGHAALRLLDEETVDLMITDIRMPQISGLHLADRLREKGEAQRPPVILISGYAEFEYARQAIELGVASYLLKPIARAKLIAAVEQALEAGEERQRIGLMRRLADPELVAAGEKEETLRDPVRAAVRYVDEHLETTFGLKEVAACVHLNPSYFSVLFKEQMDMTLSEYIARRKLQRAKEWLLRTKLPIAEIAERIGYRTAKYFNKVFKEYEGVSPGQYRAEMTREETDTQK
nr:response regulator [Cohnella zeiphila]